MSIFPITLAQKSKVIGKILLSAWQLLCLLPVTELSAAYSLSCDLNGFDALMTQTWRMLLTLTLLVDTECAKKRHPGSTLHRKYHSSRKVEPAGFLRWPFLCWLIGKNFDCQLLGKWREVADVDYAKIRDCCSDSESTIGSPNICLCNSVMIYHGRNYISPAENRREICMDIH